MPGSGFDAGLAQKAQRAQLRPQQGADVARGPRGPRGPRVPELQRQPQSQPQQGPGFAGAPLVPDATRPLVPDAVAVIGARCKLLWRAAQHGEASKAGETLAQINDALSSQAAVGGDALLNSTLLAYRGVSSALCAAATNDHTRTAHVLLASKVDLIAHLRHSLFTRSNGTRSNGTRSNGTRSNGTSSNGTRNLAAVPNHEGDVVTDVARECGICPSELKVDKQRALWLAARYGSTGVVKALLDSKAVLDANESSHFKHCSPTNMAAENLRYRYPTNVAAENGRTDVLRLLLPLDAQNVDTALDAALRCVDSGAFRGALRMLLQAKASLDGERLTRAYSPLLRAIRSSDNRAIRRLLLVKADTSYFRELSDGDALRELYRHGLSGATSHSQKLMEKALSQTDYSVVKTLADAKVPLPIVLLNSRLESVVHRSCVIFNLTNRVSKELLSRMKALIALKADPYGRFDLCTIPSAVQRAISYGNRKLLALIKSF